jgi:hypothetical protein
VWLAGGGRGSTRLETGLGIGSGWGGRWVGGRGEAFVRVVAAAAAATAATGTGPCGLLLAPRGVLLRVVR